MIEFQNINDSQHEKLLSKQLSQKHLLLDAISHSSPMAYLVVDNRDDSILYFNSQFCSMWGIDNLSDMMKRGELKNNDIIPFCLSLIMDKPGFIETCKPLQDENNRVTIEDEILFTDGRIIRRFSGQVRDESDNYIGRLYIFEDITERKKNEHILNQYKNHLEELIIDKTEELLETNAKLATEISEKQNTWNKLQKYKLLSENARDIILFIGMDGSILEVNSAAIKSYGYTYDELCTMNIQDIRSNDRVSLIFDNMEQAYAHGFRFESIHRRKDGSLFPVEVSSQGASIDGQRMLLSIVRDISERKQMQKQLEYLARHDYLTGIPNRFYLEEFLNQTFSTMRNEKDALLIIDLDNFKTVNDSYGHSVGDKVLIGVANCITGKLRNEDFIARVGGDEFAVFLSNTSLNCAQVVANKILHALEHESYYISENNIRINITASIGVTLIDDTVDVKRLFSYTDVALYEAKNHGKNRVFVLNGEEDKDLILHNNRVLTNIQDALAQNKFQIHLQPICKAGDGVIHYEVLVRMLGEKDQVLFPPSFIPLAEHYGLMPLIDKWVITNTIKLLDRDKNLNVFINLSGTSLCDTTLLDWIELTLKSSNVNLNQIGFEITETTAIKDLQNAEIWIQKIKALGCNFALDDFGVGFSSFSYLNILPIDYLKIDGTFVRNLDSDPTKLALVKAMNMVAHTLGKKTIAEYVENESIWMILQELGVDYGQGYYLGMPAEFEYIFS